MKKTVFLLLVAFVINCFPALAECDFANNVKIMDETECKTRVGAEAVNVTITEEASGYIPCSEAASFELMSDESMYEDLYGYQAVKKYDEEKKTRLAEIYLAVISAIKSHSELVEIAEYAIKDENEIRMVYDAVTGDNPDIYYLGNSYILHSYTENSVVIYTKIEFEFKDVELDDELFEQKAEELLEKSRARMAMSDFDKALLIHDTLVDHITYKVEYKDNRNDFAYLDSLFSKCAHCLWCYCRRKCSLRWLCQKLSIPFR